MAITFCYWCEKGFQKTVLLGREEGKSDTAFPDEVLRNKREILLKVLKRGSPKGSHGHIAWLPREQKKLYMCLTPNRKTDVYQLVSL